MLSVVGLINFLLMNTATIVKLALSQILWVGFTNSLCSGPNAQEETKQPEVTFELQFLPFKKGNIPQTQNIGGCRDVFQVKDPPSVDIKDKAKYNENKFFQSNSGKGFQKKY